MDKTYLNALREVLTAYDVVFEEGLSDTEIEQIECKYGFHFPSDLRAFLQFALPVSKHWMDWRHASEKELRFRLDRPLDGMCFDIECNRYWMEEWGEKPKYMHECFRIARDAVRAAPTLIPFYAYCYIPDEPTAEGNPVLWVSQTWVRYEGYDLADFFRDTFNNEIYLDSPTVLPEPPSPPWMAQAPRPVRFWDEVRARGELRWVVHQDPAQEP